MTEALGLVLLRLDLILVGVVLAVFRLGVLAFATSV